MSNPFAMPEVQSDAVASRTAMKLKRVGVFSSGVFMGAGGAALGGLAGIFVFLASLAGIGAAAQNINAGEAALGAGLMLLLMPVLYGLFGFIAGAFYAFVYNLIAGMTGGLEMEFGRD